LNELGRAKDIYTEFLKRFPKSNLADDAQASIDNLGKTPEELMKSFEHKSDSITSAKK